MTGLNRLHAPFAVATGALLVGKLLLVFQLTVHWDEFAFLAQVHEFARGELTRTFQTFNVHLFTWLLKVSGNEVDQVVWGRLCAFGLRLGCSACLYLIGRKLYGPTGAWAAVLGSVSFSMLLRHGEEFRADPILAFLFLASVTLLVFRMCSVPAVGGAAALLALAGAISIKSVIYLPAVTLVFAAWWANGLDRKMIALRLLLFGMVLLGTYSLLLYLHAKSIPVATVMSSLDSSLDYAPVILSQPDWETLNRTLRWDWAFWLLLATGTGMALSDIVERRRERWFAALVLLGMLLPLGTLATYGFSFAYFYTAIIPSASLLTGLAVARISSRLRNSTRPKALVVLGISFPMVGAGSLFYFQVAGDTIGPQRQLLNTIHEIFPEPVPYIDRCFMVAAYPKVGPFMSTHVLRDYHRRGLPIMRHVVRDRQPAFVLANASGLELDRSWDDVSHYPHQLLREDFEYLKTNYIHHWGPIWVAGAEVRTESQNTNVVELPVTGQYTLEAVDSVLLDGVLLGNGAVTQLERGVHQIRSHARPQTVRLRVGSHLKKPTSPPPPAPVFLDMGFKGLPLREARR